MHIPIALTWVLNIYPFCSPHEPQEIPLSHPICTGVLGGQRGFPL